jgi:hypothetical protein
MKTLGCVVFILCLGISDVSMAAGGGAGAGAGAGASGAGASGAGAGASGAGVGAGGAAGGGSGGTGSGFSRAGWYGREIGVRGRWTLERSRTYHRFQRHARLQPYYGRDNGALTRKTVAYDMVSDEAKPERYRRFHHTARAEEITHRGRSPATFIKQDPRDKTDTLSPGTPLLGLDPRKPSTWELYSQMLPPIFSEAPAPTSDEARPAGRHDKEPGM